MTSRIGGMDYDVSFGTEEVHVESCTLDITDNTAVAKNKGRPAGHVNGDCTAEGEIEVDEKNFNKLNVAAGAAGGWRRLRPGDMLFYANTGDEVSKVEAFGCKLILTSIINIDPNGADKSTKKIKFLVTGEEFIKINGVPVLSEDDVSGLAG
ncbi:DUF2597 family protein [Klebsiella oxytoca]|uniref:phage protein n=1 Tax=Klebsiella TaxID=570 RepID=UPI0007B3F6C9|nr:MULTISPECIES: phage protein [Klebsiella]EIY4984775.1 DUF2597 family protein [Klebsiella quasipneumoniae]KZQ49091.1 phage tail protein [Klebsiella aerogenes]KZR06877.1 phage tail protein [Klebsiella aerogenes]MCE5370095.1 DUF2597 family protein [Klebsiella oxytoca]MDK8001113.1 DUF2597 family protein [Klebsiella oxytoca]